MLFTNNAGIKALNRRYLGDVGATDVLSFCYDPMPGDYGLHVGEIVVNVERAIEETKISAGGRNTWTASDELALYIAHGCDHLSGEDDASPRQRTRMRRRELRWLKDAKAAAAFDPLI